MAVLNRTTKDTFYIHIKNLLDINIFYDIVS